MKKLLVLIFCLVAGSFVNAQSKQEKQVATVVEQLRQAMIKGSEHDLFQIASDDLVYAHSKGKIQNKKEFIGSLINGESDFVTILISDQKIKVSGKTAIVTHKLSAETNDSGKPGNVELGVMLVFQKQSGKWKLLGRQAYRP